MKHLPTAAGFTTFATISYADALTATCHNLSGALGAVSGLLRATYGHAVGDTILSSAQILSQLATGGVHAGATEPAAVRAASAEIRSTNPAAIMRRGHTSPLEGRLCLKCDHLVRPPGPYLKAKITPGSPEHDPSWAARVLCDDCRDVRDAARAGAVPVSASSGAQHGGA